MLKKGQKHKFLDLFQRSIQISGSILAEWAMNDGVIDHSKKLAQELGCDIETSEKILDCMKNMTTEDIKQATENLVRIYASSDGFFWMHH